MTGRRIARAAIVGAMIAGTIAGSAHGAGTGPARYVKRAGTDGPARIVVRTPGGSWAEDTCSTLKVIRNGITADRWTFRCLKGSEV